MRILFIDDDAVFSNALSEILEDQNIQVDQAECGETGIELADIYDYRAIVLDLGLPDMTGSDVLNELRKMATKRRSSSCRVKPRLRRG